MPLANPHLRLQQLLQALFAAQARDVLRRTSLDDIAEGKVPDLSHWVQHTAAMLKPVMLPLWQEGVVQSRRRVAALRGDVPEGGLRRHTFSTADFFGSGGTAVKSLRRVVRKDVDFYDPGFAADLYNPRILDAVDAATFEFCRATLDTATTELTQAFRDLRKLLRVGVPQGEAIQSLAQAVHRIFADPMRAYRIATTESSRAIHEGALLSAKEDPDVSGKQWLATSDPCPRCLELDGEERPLDKPFYVDPKGGPYAVVNTPPLHPHCLCTWTEVL